MKELRAAPDDDGPRLVLADELLERGDHRGELIVTQCALARGGLSRATSLECRRRERALLDEHEREWGLVGMVESWVFRRGFIEEITVDAETFLQWKDAILEHAPLLRRIRLKGLRYDSEDEDSGVSEEALEAMMPKVNAVLDVPGIDGFEPVDAVVEWPHAGAMGATYSEEGRADVGIVRQLCGSGRMRRLVDLTLRGVSEKTFGALTSSPETANVESLRLLEMTAPTHGWTEATREALGTRSTLLRPRRLELDTLSFFKIDAHLASMAEHDFFSRVEELSVNEFVGTKQLHLAGTPLLARLRWLRCEISMTGESLALITESEDLANLEELHVHRYHFDAAGKPTGLAPLLRETRLKSLRVLGLIWGLTLEMVRALIRSPLAQQLEVLDLRHNGGLDVEPLRDEWDGIILV